MKALILDNIVVEIAETTFEVAPTLKWKDCSDEVKAGWTVKGNTFSAPPPKVYLDLNGNEKPEWKRFRQMAYSDLNQFEMQYDDAVDGTTTWQDAIAAVKDAHPKPE
jgi:hypothetical protein